jgi:hypothetical protein
MAGIPAVEATHRPDLLRIGGTHLEEVYFAFQFDRTGIRRDLGRVVQRLHRNHDDVTIADWLARSNPALSHLSPLEWARSGGDPSRLLAAAESSPPDAYL